MRLNRSSNLLEEVWNSSISMTDDDLFYFDGMYWVEMATGIIPNLPNWRKYISNTEDMLPVDDNKVSGYNAIFRNGIGFPGKTFGKFGVRLYHYGKDTDDKLYLGLLLVYNNGLFKDYLRQITPDLFLGKFYMVWRKREIFMGYFWLYAAKRYRRSIGFRGMDDVDITIDEAKDINIMDDREEEYSDTIKIEPLTEKQKQELLEPIEPKPKSVPEEVKESPKPIKRKSDDMDAWTDDEGY